MSDFVIISELTVNVDEVQKDGFFYTITGTFIFDKDYSSMVNVRAFSKQDLTTLPLPLILGITGRMKYVNSPDSAISNTVFVEATEDPVVRTADDPQSTPLVTITATVAKQSSLYLQLAPTMYWNKDDKSATFEIDAELPGNRYQNSTPPSLQGQLLSAYGRLIEPRLVHVFF